MLPTSLRNACCWLAWAKPVNLPAKQFLDVLRAALGALQKTACKDAALYLTDLPVKGRDEAWKIMQTVLIAAESGYRSDQLKSKPADASTLRKILLGCARQTRQRCSSSTRAKPPQSRTA